jgi:NAD(P)-dependent dehydrogenase (short-subunit alcohol dehydrogenase family)
MTDVAPNAPLALVTGASRGLGLVLARFLAGEGYDLLLVAEHSEGLRAAAEELRELRGDVEFVAGDLASATVRRAVTTRVRERGSLDLLVNNAATLGITPFPPLEGYPVDRLESLFRVNVLAPLALVQELLPSLERGHGLVVNISSDAAVGGYPGWGGYGASKAALDLLSLTLAHELASRQVSVLSVDPGDMRTPGVERALVGEDLSSRPPPEVTLPFWAWLLHQERGRLSGHRFVAQSDRWEVPA